MKPEQQPYSLSMSEKILKADLQQEWLALNEELNKHNYLYHSIDSPEISDFQYDEMKKRLIYLEKEFPELNTENSIINKVGYFPSSNFNKIKSTSLIKVVRFFLEFASHRTIIAGCVFDALINHQPYDKFTLTPSI